MPAVTLLNPNDPLFAFEHMMAHRQYFAVMRPLDGFSALPYLLDPTSNTNQPASPWNLNHQQAHNDFMSNLPSNYVSGYTSTTITPPLITVIGNSIPAGTASTTIQLTSVTPPQIIIGSDIFGFGVTITAQQTGIPGGDGNYTISGPLNVTGAAMTVAHAPFQDITETVNAGTISMNLPGILLEGTGTGNPENDPWWTFTNHQQHYEANNAILPLPTTQPLYQVTGPDGTVVNVSDPWWWALRGPVIYPFW